MAGELEELDLGVLRQRNRVLVGLNRKLRESHRELGETSDAAFLAFLETETEAERALRSLWERSRIDCDPHDYEGIVVHCLTALAAQGLAEEEAAS